MANEFKIRKGLIVEGASGGTVVDVQGSQGQLFSVTDDLSGSIFAVSDISGVPILNVNSSGAVDIDGTLNLGDSDKIQLGASQDLQIFHNGSNSYIETSSSSAGDFYIKALGTNHDLYLQAADDIFIRPKNGENGIKVLSDDSVELYFNNVRKLRTTSTGVNVEGNGIFAGKVGIGITTTPIDELEIGNLSNYTGLTLKGVGASRPAITFKNITQSLLGAIYGTEGRGMIIETGGNGTAGTVAMTLSSAGALKLNTYTAGTLVSDASGNITVSSGGGAGGPYLPLAGGTVTGNLTTNGIFTIQNAAPYIQWKDVAGTRLGYIQHNATNLVMSADTGQIQFDTTANNDILINPGGTGKVGIGTTGPGEKLSVNGNIESLDTLILNYANNGIKWQQLFDGANSWNLRYYNGSAWSNSAITVKANGNVGIGTSSPTGYRLVVENTSEDLLKLHNSTDGLDSLISFTNPGGTLGRIQGIDNGGLAFDVGNNAGGVVSNAMFIKNNGNVSVGDTTAQRKFNVLDATDAWIRISATDYSSDWLIGTAGSDTKFKIYSQTAGLTRLAITPDGDVGIGTTAINGAFGASNTILAVKGKSSGGEGIIQITGLGNNADDTVGVLAFHSYNEADAMCSIRSIRGNADDVGNIAFLTNNGGTESERMRIDSSGDVQLQTVGGKLRFQNSAGPAPYIKNSGENSSTAPYGQNLEFYTGGSKRLTIDTSGNATFAGSLDVGTFTLAGSGIIADAGMTLQTNAGGVNAITLASNGDANFTGKVGIGTTNPQRSLQLRSTNQSTGIFLERTSNYGFVQYNEIVGSVETYHLGFVNNNTFSSDILVANESGNVGIGTSTPNAKLDIQGTQGQLFSVTDDLSGEIFAVADISGVPIMTVNSSGLSSFDGKVEIGSLTGAVANGQASQLWLKSPENNGMTISSGNSKTGTIFFGDVANSAAGGFRYNHNTGDMAISAEDNVTFACDNVGIGTTNPDTKLQVAATGSVGFSVRSNTSGDAYMRLYSDTTIEADWFIDRSASTINFRTVQSKPLVFATNNSEAMRITSTGKIVLSNGNIESPSDILLSTDTGSQLIIALQIKNSTGNTIIANKLGVGSTADPLVPLDVTVTDTGSSFNDGAVQFSNETSSSSGGATVVNIKNNYYGGFGTLIKFFRQSTSSSIANISFNSGGTAVNYNTGSDYRLKEDLQTFNGLDILSNISVYNYKWRGVDFRGYGVIAHELQPIFPDAVTGEKDAEEMQSVDYSKLVPVLIKSVQELKKEIELLKQQLNK